MSAEQTLATRTTMRRPRTADGASIWTLIDEMGGLELNSAYCYLLMCRDFAEASVIAEQDGEVAGFVVGYRPPKRPEAVFVWQIGVAPWARRQQLGLRMLDSLFRRPELSDARYLEATVTPGNEASRKLFRRFATRHDAECEVEPCMEASDFPVDHEAEELFRIGPLEPSPSPGNESRQTRDKG